MEESNFRLLRKPNVGTDTEEEDTGWKGVANLEG